MARKNKEPEKKKKVNTDGVMGLHGSTTEQAISETLEINYMPYAMSVIVSRAIRPMRTAPAVWELEGPTITGPRISNKFIERSSEMYHASPVRDAVLSRPTTRKPIRGLRPLLGLSAPLPS